MAKEKTGGEGGRRFGGGLVNSLKRHFSKFRCRSISGGEVHDRTYPWVFEREVKAISYEAPHYCVHEEKLSFSMSHFARACYMRNVTA